MSRDLAPNEEPLTSSEQLRAWFLEGAKGASARLGVGTEHEKFGFLQDTLAPLPFDGPSGIEALLLELQSRYGYEPQRDAGRTVALLRDGAAISLEPGGQFELSGAVLQTVHQTREELRTHLHEVNTVGAELGQVWTHLAMNPWESPDEIPQVPKSRYKVMASYLPQVGPLAPWMMKTTATVQANYDFRDEADAMDILFLAAWTAPMVTALFANSPERAQSREEAVSQRMLIWEETDPARCGMPDTLLRRGADLQDYIDYCLDVPMFFVQRDGQYIDMAGFSFRKFMKEGYAGHHATMGDWELHLTTVFPDVRMKRYIEVRTADAGLPGHLLALPALYKGLLYDEQARMEMHALLGEELSAVQWNEWRRLAAREGLEAQLGARSMRELATAFVQIAGEGLDRIAAQEGHESERQYLGVLLDGAGSAREAGLVRDEAYPIRGEGRAAVVEQNSLTNGLAWMEARWPTEK